MFHHFLTLSVGGNRQPWLPPKRLVKLNMPGGEWFSTRFYFFRSFRQILFSRKYLFCSFRLFSKKSSSQDQPFIEALSKIIRKLFNRRTRRQRLKKNVRNSHFTFLRKKTRKKNVIFIRSKKTSERFRTH